MDQHRPNPLPISLEQQKLLASAVRIKILHVLSDTPHTAKQVADLIGETPGNVHYHMQRLFNGELIELDHTHEVGGIIEKYYKSIGTRFKHQPTEGKWNIFSQLTLTPMEIEQLLSELEHVLYRFEQTTARANGEGATEIVVKLSLEKIPHENTDSGGTRHGNRIDV